MMWLFLLNLFLAIVYVALTGELSFFNFLIGFALGWVILTLYCRVMGMRSYAGKFYRLFRFTLYFTKNMIRANIDVAYEVLTPGFHHMQPRIVRYPVHDLTDAQITTFANAISLTPGTLSTDIDEKDRVLYVHDMYAKDRARSIADLDELKQRLLEDIFR